MGPVREAQKTHVYVNLPPAPLQRTIVKYFNVCFTLRPSVSRDFLHGKKTFQKERDVKIAGVGWGGS